MQQIPRLAFVPGRFQHPKIQLRPGHRPAAHADRLDRNADQSGLFLEQLERHLPVGQTRFGQQHGNGRGRTGRQENGFDGRRRDAFHFQARKQFADMVHLIGSKIEAVPVELKIVAIIGYSHLARFVAIRGQFGLRWQRECFGRGDRQQLGRDPKLRLQFGDDLSLDRHALRHRFGREPHLRRTGPQ